MSDFSDKLKEATDKAIKLNMEKALPEVTRGMIAAAAKEFENWLASDDGEASVTFLKESSSRLVLVGSQSGATVNSGYCLDGKGLFGGTEYPPRGSETSPRETKDYSVSAYEVLEAAWTRKRIRPENFLSTVISDVERLANWYVSH